MSVSPTSSRPAPLTPAAPANPTHDKSPDQLNLLPITPPPARQAILLVGPDALAARSLLAPFLDPSASPVDTAESLLEALLIAGNASRAPAPPVYTIIVASVAGEIDHLEDALRHLRHITSTAKIVLLCEPPEESICRQALHWGADDYFIVPLDAKSTRKIATGNCGRPPRAVADPLPKPVSSPHPAAPRHPAPVHAQPPMPLLPLALQTEILDEFLATGMINETAEFAAAALARLAPHLSLQSKLHFEPAGPTPLSEPPRRTPHPSDIRLPVQVGDQLPFGTLILQPPQTPNAPAIAREIAAWLAALLSLAQHFKQLRSLAITDELSGAYNRRYFMTYMTKLIQIAEKNQARITLLLFDIDDFKKYNDTFGHASGDAIIRELIKLLRACTREYDLVARIGGDEFAVVYRDNEPRRQPNSDHPKDVLTATERFREAIRNHHWPQTCNIKGEISISGGLATYPWHAHSLEDLLAKADEALLRAKAAGKNVIVMHAPATDADPAREHPGSLPTP